MAKQLVQDVMTPQPLTFPDTATVADAARAMRESNIGDVLVTHEDQLCGIITDRDIVIRVVADNLDPMTTRLSAVCSDRPLTLAPTADIEQAVETMREAALRRLPVVDGGRVVGIVTLGDLAVSQDPTSALSDISAAAPDA